MHARVQSSFLRDSHEWPCIAFASYNTTTTAPLTIHPHIAHTLPQTDQTALYTISSRGRQTEIKIRVQHWSSIGGRSKDKNCVPSGYKHNHMPTCSLVSLALMNQPSILIRLRPAACIDIGSISIIRSFCRSRAMGLASLWIVMGLRNGEEATMTGAKRLSLSPLSSLHTR